LAQGYFHYYCERDYDRAIASFEKSRQLSPNNSQILIALGYVYRRKGQWERSLSYFRQAVELDPRDVAVLGAQAEVFWDLRQYQALLEADDRVLDIIPGDVGTLADKAGIYQAQGDLPAAAALLAPLHLDTNSKLFFTQMDQWIYERRYADAIQALTDRVKNPAATATPFEKFYFKSQLAWVQQLSGDTDSARTTWQQVRTDLEGLYRSDSENIDVIVGLARANAALGDKTKAFALAERATELARLLKDAVTAANVRKWLAKIAMQMGEAERALSILEYSARVPAGVNYGELKLNPLWDPLRGDPRFEKIVASLAPKKR
jgi:tetratricopeptide (TPR) repeat protein